MFCTTFYSYKGGVGRTLALVNVATILAQNGKRVLIVDFDLEAPGLTTLKILRSADKKPGLVDFVSQYEATGSVPIASEFIYSCVVEEGENVETAFKIDVLPAGEVNDNYTAQLSRIDWHSLYDQKNGFLLMEDLRAQWSNLGYDYVLIDSRTGHTDVGGICTRQLPDAVVNIFFPNEQNLLGMKQVVEEIRNHGARPEPIDMLFVASRVPRLDDEHGLLKHWLEKFEGALQYDKEDLTVIEHYDSMSLLDQDVFALERPKSGLSKQYRKLAANISRLNCEDPDGAVSFLRSLLARGGPSQQAPKQPIELDPNGSESTRLQKISDLHSDDYIIQWMLAVVFEDRRDLMAASGAVEKGLTAGDSTKTSGKALVFVQGRLHQLRIRIAGEFGDDDAISASAKALLEDERSSQQMVLDALIALSNSKPDVFPKLTDLPALRNSTPKNLAEIADRLSVIPAASKLAASIAEQALQTDSVDWLNKDLAFTLQMLLVAGKSFDLADSLSQYAGTSGFLDMAFTFNSAVASWGHRGKPSKDAFEKFLEVTKTLDPDYQPNPNYHQCMALAFAVLGKPEKVGLAIQKAKALIENEGLRREFSCWTFAYVPINEFSQHCDAILEFSRGRGPSPQSIMKDTTPVS